MEYNKPFWTWNIEEHKQEDIKTNGNYCFNHIIGLPQKDGNDKPPYDYERIIFDSLTDQYSMQKDSMILYISKICRNKLQHTMCRIHD